MKKLFKKFLSFGMSVALVFPVVFFGRIKALGNVGTIRILKGTGLRAIVASSAERRAQVSGLGRLANSLERLESKDWTPRRGVAATERERKVLKDIHYNIQAVRYLHEFFLSRGLGSEVHRQAIIVDHWYQNVYRNVNTYINYFRTTNYEYLNNILTNVLALLNKYLLFQINDSGIVVLDETFDLGTAYRVPTEAGQNLMRLCRFEIL